MASSNVFPSAIAAFLDAEMQTPDEGVESPGREIREMLKNHDEPLEEWKD